MSEDGGNIVPADRVRPGFEKRLDSDFFRVGVVRNGFGSFVLSEDEPRGVNRTRARSCDEIAVAPTNILARRYRDSRNRRSRC
jgi:hypothetical protein